MKNPPDKEGDTGSIPGPGRSPGEGNDYPLQYSSLGNPMDGAWWTILRGVTKSWTWRGDWTTTAVLLGNSMLPCKNFITINETLKVYICCSLFFLSYYRTCERVTLNTRARCSSRERRKESDGITKQLRQQWAQGATGTLGWRCFLSMKLWNNPSHKKLSPLRLHEQASFSLGPFSIFTVLVLQSSKINNSVR